MGAEAPKGDGDGLPNAGLAWPKTEDPAAGALVAPKDEAAGCPNADEPNPVLPAAAPKAEEPPKADPVEAPKRPADAGCCCCGCWGCPKTEVEPKGDVWAGCPKPCGGEVGEEAWRRGEQVGVEGRGMARCAPVVDRSPTRRPQTQTSRRTWNRQTRRTPAGARGTAGTVVQCPEPIVHLASPAPSPPRLRSRLRGRQPPRLHVLPPQLLVALVGVGRHGRDGHLRHQLVLEVPGRGVGRPRGARLPHRRRSAQRLRWEGASSQGGEGTLTEEVRPTPPRLSARHLTAEGHRASRRPEARLRLGRPKQPRAPAPEGGPGRRAKRGHAAAERGLLRRGREGTAAGPGQAGSRAGMHPHGQGHLGCTARPCLAKALADCGCPKPVAVAPKAQEPKADCVCAAKGDGVELRRRGGGGRA